MLDVNIDCRLFNDNDWLNSLLLIKSNCELTRLFLRHNRNDRNKIFSQNESDTFFDSNIDKIFRFNKVVNQFTISIISVIFIDENNEKLFFQDFLCFFCVVVFLLTKSNRYKKIIVFIFTSCISRNQKIENSSLFRATSITINNNTMQFRW